MKIELKMEFDSLKEMNEFLCKKQNIEISSQEIKFKEPQKGLFRKGKQMTQYELDTIADFYQKGHRIKEIAKSLGRSYNSINCVLWKMRKKGLRCRVQRSGKAVERSLS